MAIALGIAAGTYRSVMVSDFGFEITHAYARNPQIEERIITYSQDAGFDIAVLSYLARKYGTIYTSNAVVRERTGVPLLTGQPALSTQSAAFLSQPPQSREKLEYIAWRP